MSLKNIHVEWKVEGPNWTQTVFDSIKCTPMEIATKAIENTFNFKKAFNTNDNDYVLGLGIILMVSHAQMTSVDEIYICHTPTVLANASLYKQSELLQNMIDKILKQ
jgi:hypothetical protein